ncbi:MAG TPA: hypothetical protein VG733_03905 [Chthoniobacteraceae bacterium]|nr:hypothetical protein [Chthoniobacteraceae bacterium]
MIPFFLFFITAACICSLTYSWGGHALIMSGVQKLGYVAAATMFLAAYISAFSLWAGRIIAGTALVLVAGYCLSENIGLGARQLTPVVLLDFLMLAAALAYVLGSFRVKVQTPLYPRHASKVGKGIAWLFVVVPLLGFCWWAFVHDAAHDRYVTVPASWEEANLTQVTSGRHQLKFTAQDSSLSVTVASDELFDQLQADPKKQVDVVIRETFKHGTMVAWSVESIAGSQTFALLDKQPQMLKQ